MAKARIVVVAKIGCGVVIAKVKMKLKRLSWNVRGANNLDKRKIISNFVRSQRVDLVCIQETKIQDLSNACARSFGVGRLHDWKALEAEGAAEVSFCFGTNERWTWLRLRLAVSLSRAFIKMWKMGLYGLS